MTGIFETLIREVAVKEFAEASKAGMLTLSFEEFVAEKETQFLDTLANELQSRGFAVASSIQDSNERAMLTEKDLIAKYKCSHSSIYRWERLGYIKPMRIGKRKKVYDPEEIEKVLKGKNTLS